MGRHANIRDTKEETKEKEKDDTAPNGNGESDLPVEMGPANNSATEGYEDSKIENKQPVIGTLVMKTVGIIKRKTRKPVGFMQSCCFVFVDILSTYK